MTPLEQGLLAAVVVLTVLLCGSEVLTFIPESVVRQSGLLELLVSIARRVGEWRVQRALAAGAALPQPTAPFTTPAEGATAAAV